MNRRATLLAILVGGMSAVPAFGAATKVRVVGSDLLLADGQQALVAYAAGESAEVSVALKGSLPGREALLQGQADIALLAHAPQLEGADNAAPELAGYRRVRVAWVAGVFLVAAENPVTQVTYEQLAGVFGASGASAARYWGSLGAEGEWAARAITPGVVAREHGLTLDLFMHAVLLDRPLQPGLPELNAGPGQPPTVDMSGIVLWPNVPAGASGVRALLVTPVAGEVAFGPSGENIATGDYPLALPLELVFRAGAESTVAPVIRFFASEAGVAAVEASLLVPLPANARARLQAEFRR